MPRARGLVGCIPNPAGSEHANVTPGGDDWDVEFSSTCGSQHDPCTSHRVRNFGPWREGELAPLGDQATIETEDDTWVLRLPDGTSCTRTSKRLSLRARRHYLR